MNTPVHHHVSLPGGLLRPLRNVGEWARHLSSVDIPVMAATADCLEVLRAREDDVDANMLGEAISDDPLMTLKVLIHASSARGARVVTDAETVTSALIMLGISPFFAAFGPQPTVDDWLAEEPEALLGLSETLHRSHRAANFALGFAVHRMDNDAAVIHSAALLHDFAELLLWCHAPKLALSIRRMLRDQPGLRSSAAQLATLNVLIADLQQAMMRTWRLPELLVKISDDRLADNPSVRSVMLAVRLARHTAESWNNPALSDDIRDIAALLNLSQSAALQLVREI